VISQNEPFSGILGFVTCIRKEPGLNILQSVFIDDPEAPQIDVNHPFYLFIYLLQFFVLHFNLKFKVGVGKISRVMSNPHSKIDPNMSGY
jgi:hypothetical protein